MKIGLILLLPWCFVFTGCSSKTEPLPADTWSQECYELVTDRDGFRLTGMCCSYLIFPRVDLDKNHAFTVDGLFYSFNGAGFIGSPTRVTGMLSPDNGTLTISYGVNAVASSYSLKPGRATMSCQCGCD